MERFWKAALSVAGIGAVAFFVFFGLYRQWLKLSIFPQLTQEQAFILMLVFLGLTFLSLVLGLWAWMSSNRGRESEDAALHRLEDAWKGVNYIDCRSLVGPDINNAANALKMTSAYWRNGYIRRELLAEQYGLQFCELFEQIIGCDKVVPGYTSPEKRCRDFLSAPVRSTYGDVAKLLKR
jgi:hypothetical protein